MKVKLVNYEHAENGVSLQLIPESDVEEQLLRSIWKHGKMNLGHPGKEQGGIGFYVSCWEKHHDQT